MEKNQSHARRDSPLFNDKQRQIDLSRFLAGFRLASFSRKKPCPPKGRQGKVFLIGFYIEALV
jgi:hypothetical protein